MNAIALRAHFDGKQICLDEPFELQPEAKLIVTVLLEDQPDNEREDWLQLSMQGLEAAYDPDEVEYSLKMLVHG